MLQRVLAAVVGLLLIVPAIVWGGMAGTHVVAGLALLVAFDEYSRMALGERHLFGKAALLLAGVPVYLSSLLRPELVGPALALGAMGCFLAAMVHIPRTDEGTQAAMRLGAGLLYVPLLFSFIVKVRELPDGLAWLFLTLSVTWAGDTGAYFAGRAFGRRKLFERVSPKKTWEGAVGGFLFSILFCVAYTHWLLPGVGLLAAVALGAVLDVVGVVGDLVESMFKRAFGVKDSGWIMPGHGGILDRIDSVLFTAPVTWLFVVYLLPGPG